MEASDLIQTVTVGNTDYVVHPVDAQTQYKILQKLGRYGIGELLSGIIKSEGNQEHVKLAYVQTVVIIIQRMPEEDQDFCIQNALANTCVKGETEPVDISLFTGRIAEYILLGARAIGVQLGDFSSSLSPIESFIAGARGESE